MQAPFQLSLQPLAARAALGSHLQVPRGKDGCPGEAHSPVTEFPEPPPGHIIAPVNVTSHSDSEGILEVPAGRIIWQ